MESTASPRIARILIVDDSTVMRSLLRSVVSSDQRLEVAGAASDGASAVRAMDSLKPDLVLLDVEMPVMDGLNTLRQMRARGNRVPVIMCSSLTQRGAKVTIEALASGAADYVTKPFGQPSRETAVCALAQELIPKILALTASQIASPSFFPPRQGTFLAAPPNSAYNATGQGQPGIPAVPRTRLIQPHGNLLSPDPAHAALAAISTGFAPAVVVIGVSTGGPAALDLLLAALPANFPLPVLVVQHMPELFTRLLAARLDSRCPLHIAEATSGETIQPGTVYIAKGDWHLEIVSPSAYRDRSSANSAVPPILAMRLTQDPLENHCRPAVDVLFRTAVQVYGSRVLGVVLTGMGSDGLAGSRLIRENQGTVIAQDQPTSAVWGMPGAVVQAGLANRILPLPAIAPEILRLACRSQREACELPESAV